MSQRGADVFEKTEHAARAKLSRIIRNSEAGWLFYSPGGTAYYILKEEAEKLERRALRRLKKCSWVSAELGKLAGKSFKLALAALAISIGLVMAMGSAWLDPFGDLFAAYVFPSLILFALFFGFLRPIVSLVIRASVMLLWQAEEARRLRAEGRGAVPLAIEKSTYATISSVSFFGAPSRS